MSVWQPIATAPRDGTHITGRESLGSKLVTLRGKEVELRRWRKRKTWWGKTSHVPLRGWCHGRDVENIDLWQPTHWRPEDGA